MNSFKLSKINYFIAGIGILALCCICFSGCVTINTPANDSNQNNQQNTQSNQQNAQTNNQQNNQNATPQSGDEQRAKNVAISDAGFNESQVNVIKCHLDYDDGIQKYEIEFTNGTNKYEYDIAATDFRIIKKEIDSIYD